MTQVLQLQDHSEISLRIITDATELNAIKEQSTGQDTNIFDYTKLSAINTCPTWGIARYGKHLSLGGSGRSTALDAGTACHKYFHALRLWHIYYNQKNHEAYLRAGSRLFGKEYCLNALRIAQDSDTLTNAINFCTPFLHDSGFYDDPNDRRRTLANLEATCIAYTERRLRNFSDIYINGNTVGIEIPFAIEIKSKDSTWYFVGKIDGLHTSSEGRPIVEENKTVSLGWGGDSWRMKWNVEHQPTGYMVAGALLVGMELDDLQGTIIGSQIPTPKNVFEATIVESVRRTHDDIIRWLEWQRHTIEIYNKYSGDLISAPRYTTACSRFNKACSMIPFCAATIHEQGFMLEDDFTFDPWIPLQDEVVE